MQKHNREHQLLFANKLKLNILIGLGAFFTPIGYIIFAFSTDFIWASIGFFTLTFFLSFANIGFLTFYQNNVPIEIMGMFSSFIEILEAGYALDSEESARTSAQ